MSFTYIFANRVRSLPETGKALQYFAFTDRSCVIFGKNLIVNRPVQRVYFL